MNIRLFFKDSGIYAFGSIIAIFIATYQINYVTHFLSPQEYKNIGIFLATYSIFLPLVNFSQHAVLGKVLFDDSKDLKNYHISAAFYNSVILSVIYLFFGNLILFIFNFESQLFFIMCLAIFCALLQTFQVYIRSWLQVKRAVIRYTIILISSQLLLLLAIVILFEFDTEYFKNRILGQVIVSFLMFITLAFTFNCLVFPREQLMYYMRSSLKKSLQFVPHSFISAFNGNFDRFLALYFLTPAQAGMYFVYSQLSSGVFSAFQPLNNALVPRVFARISREGGEISNRFVRYYLSMIIIFIVIATLVVSYLAQIVVPYLVAPEYLKGMKAFVWLLIFQILQIGSMFTSTILTYHLNGIQISISTILSLTGYLFLLFHDYTSINSVSFAIALVIGAALRFMYLWCATFWYSFKTMY